MHHISLETGALKSSTNKSTKPPKPATLLRAENLGQLFFIEYQFPVIASTREHEEKARLSPSPSNSSTAIMATQVMRVNASKRLSSQNTEDSIVFENSAEYSVLFNSNLLETWWRSAICFKIYCRASTSVATTTTAPHLVGIARLDLKNVLKSRNFKLYKKLAVYDQLTSSGKRIGTLHVKIELSSDLKEFNTDLVKLKNFEAKNGKVRLVAKKSSPQKNTKTPLTASKTGHSKLSSLISAVSPPVLKQPTIEEFSLPMQMFLSINEGRGFSSVVKNANSGTTSIYLICRLFWNREKVKFEVDNHGDSHFSWTLNLSFLIKPSLIENMRNNFMIIEAWQKSDAITATAKDSLIGTVKLPLNEFYLKLSDLVAFRRFLSDSALQPLIGVNGWISVCDPFTGNDAMRVLNTLSSLKFRLSE